MAQNPLLLPSFAQLREATIKALNGRGFDYRTPVPPPPETAEGEPIPAPVAPVEESRQAYLPYRGTEFHGVTPPDDPALHEDAEGYGPPTVDVVYEPPADPQASAINVRVISDSAEQLTAWRVNQLTAPPAGSPPSGIASRQRNRTKLQIKNMSETDGVWVGPTAEVSAFNGYLIDPGDELTLSSTESVYALANGPNLVPVCLLTEFTQEA